MREELEEKHRKQGMGEDIEKGEEGIKRSSSESRRVDIQGRVRSPALSCVLCDLASSSQTVDYSSILRSCQSQPGLYTLLLITPTHNRSAVQQSAQNIDVCGACGGDHAKQIALGGISQALCGMNPAMNLVFIGMPSM